MNHCLYTCRSKLSSSVTFRCPTSASSHYLADALCSMPNLTDLMILVGKEFQEEFYSTLNAKASTLQVCMCVCTLYPCHDEFRYTCSSGDEFKEFLCLSYEVAGGIMFSGCPSVCPIVRLYTRLYVRTSRSRDHVI